MKSAFRFLVSVGKAALVFAAGYFALMLLARKLLFAPNTPTDGQIVAAIGAVFLPAGLGAWWLFLLLRTHFSRREARAVAITFVLFAPVSLAIANLLYAIPGSIAAPLLSKSRYGFLVALLVGIAVITALLASVACGLAMWITRRTERAEQHDLLKPGL